MRETTDVNLLLELSNPKSQFDALCFTSNGVVNKAGAAIMGAGIALAFKNKLPALPNLLGRHIRKNGNTPAVLVYIGGKAVVNFPTKNNWRDKSDIDLILKSAKELVRLSDWLQFKTIGLPRPGCLNGGLDWHTQVRPTLLPVLDDRFIICTI